MSDSDESCDLFELYVGDGAFAQHTGLSEDEYSQLFDGVLPLSAGRRPSVLSLTDHTLLVTTLEWLKANAPFRTLAGHLAQREETVRHAIWNATTHLADHFHRHLAIAWPPALRDVLADVPVATMATDFSGAIGPVGVTEIPIQCPTVKRESLLLCAP